MKTCVSSYSFGRAVKRGELQFMDIIPKAKEMGFDAFEFSSLPVPEGMTEAEFAIKLAERAKECDMPIVQYSVGADMLGGGDAEVERLKGSVDAAVLLGAYGLRHDITFRMPDPHRFDWLEAVKIIAPRIRALTEYAAGKGVRTMSENHGQIFQAPERVIEMVRAVGNPNYGLLVDIGNFICADVDPLMSTAATAPFAMHVHVKDFIMKPGSEPNPGGWGTTLCGNYFRGTVVGHGVIKVKQSLDVLKKFGYDGNVSIEFEGWEDNLQALEAGLANLRRFIG